ncbi:hypothetical protein AMTRI_Chr13g122480 [Amborella trichopoda]
MEWRKRKRRRRRSHILVGWMFCWLCKKAFSAKKAVSTSPRRRDRKKMMSNEDLVDDRDVRPIVIKSDWATRLQEPQKLFDDRKMRCEADR